MGQDLGTGHVEGAVSAQDSLIAFVDQAFETNEALGFDLLTNLKRDFEAGRFSWVGPYGDFALGYLSFASVLNAHVDSHVLPVGSFVIGKSATGKTQFIESLTELFPDELVIPVTTSSAKALIYECKENPAYLNGKVVFVEELSGLRNPEIQYLLRVLLTKGYAVHTTVQGGTAERVEVYGKISLQSTGLNDDGLRDDTMNRLLIFKSDHSKEKTKEVIGAIRNRYINPGRKSSSPSAGFSVYHSFFKSLKPYRVKIPYADKIEFDPENHESRRLSKIFFDLLTTVALINQHQRVIDADGDLVSEREDLEQLIDLSSVPVTQEMPRLTPSHQAVWDIAKALPDVFSYQDIENQRPRDETGKLYDISSIRKAVQKLTHFGLVEIVSNGRPVKHKVRSSASTNRFGASIM